MHAECLGRAVLRAAATDSGFNWLALFFSLTCSFSFLLSREGDALLDAGEAMKRLAEVKDSLDIEVKQNFIDPLQNLCDKDLKEIQVTGKIFLFLSSPPPPLQTLASSGF